MKTSLTTELTVTFDASEARELLKYINQNSKPEGAVADLYADLTEILSSRFAG